MPKLSVMNKAIGLLRTNCYVIGNEQTKEAVIIDPADNAPVIMEICEQNHLTPVAVLLTHGHFDHILAAERIRKAYSIPLYAGLAEKLLLSDPALSGAGLLRKSVALTADQWLEEHTRLALAGFQIEVIATPGHTPGSVCYYIKEEGVLFSGDTLFKRSFGRTDFPLGDEKALYQSITQKLFTLPGETVVYPGHDAQTTIADEKQNNRIYLL